MIPVSADFELTEKKKGLNSIRFFLFAVSADSPGHFPGSSSSAPSDHNYSSFERSKTLFGRKKGQRQGALS
jgi:hypothetical protein